MNQSTNHPNNQTRAQSLAAAAFFRRLARAGGTVFGEMPGADGTTHGVVFQSEISDFRCTCPFRPKPCWHALALAQLFEKQPDAFAEANDLPDWATALLAGEAAPMRRTASPETKAAEKQKRRFERLERAAAGFDDLENWLADTARRGLATVVAEDPKFYETIAARVADASMTSLSRQFRLLGQIRTTEPDWAERMLAVLADAHLAVRSFRQRDQLPEALLHDLQNFIGIATKKDEVLASGERVADIWAVLAVREDMLENGLAGRRTWLFGGKTGRMAVVQDYAFLSAAPFAPGLRAGDVLRGEAVFYPSAFPLRVLLEGAEPLPRKVEKMPGYADFQVFAQDFAKSVGRQPWLTAAGQTGFPAAFEAVIPVFSDGKFWLVDEAGRQLPLAVRESGGWQMLALSGGQALGVFGEWDGAALTVLSVAAEGRLVSMPGFRVSGSGRDAILLPAV